MTSTESEIKESSQDDPSEENGFEVQAVDVFCGIGGLTRGLRTAGIRVVAGADVDPSCRYAYEINNPDTTFLEADIRDIGFSDLEPHFGTSDLVALVGCAPCQPFSAHTRGTGSTDDCALVGEFARLVRECAPDLVSMETCRASQNMIRLGISSACSRISTTISDSISSIFMTTASLNVVGDWSCWPLDVAR